MRINPRHIIGFLTASRVPNLLIISYTQYVCALFLMKVESFEILHMEFLLFVMSTMAIGAAGYIINDYFDRKVDLVNRPNTVVIGSSRARRVALVSHLTLSLVGVSIGLYVKLEIGLVHCFSVLALWTYSAVAKHILLIDTIIIALLSSLTLLTVLVYFEKINFIVFAYAAFAGVAVFIRETLKDIISVKGEDLFGYQTVPIVWGIRGAKWLIFIASIAGLGLLSFYLISVKNWNTSFFFGGILVISIQFIYWLYRADKVLDFKQLKLAIDLIIVSGLVSMLTV